MSGIHSTQDKYIIQTESLTMAETENVKKDVEN